MTARSNPTDRSKLGKAKRHILTDKKGIPLSAVISSLASTHDIKLVTNVVDNAVIHKRPPSYKTKKTGKERRRKLQHLCLDKAYNSESEEQELIKRGYMLHIPSKRKKGKKEELEAKITVQHCSNRKKLSAKRWVVERTNSWYNRFRKLFTRYEKKVENYLGLVQLSCCMIIYRKIIFGIGS
jgi:transposase